MCVVWLWKVPGLNLLSKLLKLMELSFLNEVNYDGAKKEIDNHHQYDQSSSEWPIIITVNDVNDASVRNEVRGTAVRRSTKTFRFWKTNSPSRELFLQKNIICLVLHSYIHFSSFACWDLHLWFTPAVQLDWFLTQAAEDKSNHLNRIKVSCKLGLIATGGIMKMKTESCDKKDENGADLELMLVWLVFRQSLSKIWTSWKTRWRESGKCEASLISNNNQLF